MAPASRYIPLYTHMYSYKQETWIRQRGKRYISFTYTYLRAIKTWKDMTLPPPFSYCWHAFSFNKPSLAALTKHESTVWVELREMVDRLFVCYYITVQVLIMIKTDRIRLTASSLQCIWGRKCRQKTSFTHFHKPGQGDWRIFLRYYFSKMWHTGIICEVFYAPFTENHAFHLHF